MIPDLLSEPPIPPLPMTRREARAAGLKTFTSMATCRRCGSKQRTVHTGACCGCLEAEQRKLKAVAERVRKQVSQQVSQRVMKSARVKVLRELDKEARDAAKAAEKAARSQQRQAEQLKAEKQRKANARAVARTARLAAAAIEHQPTTTTDAPPWDDRPNEPECDAPWD